MEKTQKKKGDRKASKRGGKERDIIWAGKKELPFIKERKGPNGSMIKKPVDRPLDH